MSRYLPNVLKYSVIKRKYSEYVLKNCDIRQAFDILERFAIKHFVLISNIDENHNNEKRKRAEYSGLHSIEYAYLYL